MTALVCVLGLITTVVALWARDVLFDSHEVAKAVEAALAEPEVTDALAGYLADQVMVAVGVDDVLTTVLPPAIDELGPIIADGVRAYVTDRLADALADEQVRATIVTITERSHRALMRVLDGDGLADGITVGDGEVKVNLLPLIARGLRIVQSELGLLDRVEVPTFAADGDPAEQRAELAGAIGRPLPAEFGELVVYRGEAVAKAEASVQTAQRLVLIAKRAMLAVMAITVVAGVLSVALARRRLRALILLLLAGTIAMVAVRALVNRVIATAPTLVLQPGASAAIASVVASLAGGLVTAASLVALLGAAAAVVLWITGENPIARRLRADAPVRTTIAVAGVATAVLVLLVGGLGWIQVALAVVLAAGPHLLPRRRAAAYDPA